jgi:Translation initiation factor 2 (IF-2; GTPase)
VEGEIHIKDEVRIMRQSNQIGSGKIVELQQAKQKVGIVEEGKEFGMSFDSEVTIAPGDFLEVVEVVEQ